MITAIARFIKGTLPQRAPGQRNPSLKELQAIRTALLQCVIDCENVPAHRLRHKIELAKSAQELWLLRNDAYQLIAQQTSQAVAAQRINSVIGHFEGLLEPGQLARIK